MKEALTLESVRDTVMEVLAQLDIVAVDEKGKASPSEDAVAFVSSGVNFFLEASECNIRNACYGKKRLGFKNSLSSKKWREIFNVGVDVKLINKVFYPLIYFRLVRDYEPEVFRYFSHSLESLFVDNDAIGTVTVCDKLEAAVESNENISEGFRNSLVESFKKLIRRHSTEGFEASKVLNCFISIFASDPSLQAKLRNIIPMIDPTVGPNEGEPDESKTLFVDEFFEGLARRFYAPSLCLKDQSIAIDSALKKVIRKRLSDGGQQEKLRDQINLIGFEYRENAVTVVLPMQFGNELFSKQNAINSLLEAIETSWNDDEKKKPKGAPVTIVVQVSETSARRKPGE